MSTPRRLYLLDASHSIFRAFHSTNPKAGNASSLSTSKGLPTNALLVFTNMLRKLLKDHGPDHVACVFDVSDVTFRTEKFAAYKGTRSETPPALVPQFPYFRPIVEGLGIRVVEADGFEADDVIATLARRAREAGWEAVVVSSDKDLMQLLCEGVRMYDAMKDEWVTSERVLAKFGVGPEKVVEVQALIGDTVDNIPGVKGIGQKTAATLIEQYGTLEGIYAHIGELKGKLRERLEEGVADAYLSRELATLRDDVALDVTLDELAVREPDRDKLTELFQELEFKSLLREFIVTRVAAVAAERHVATSPEDLTRLAERLAASPRFALQLVGSHAQPMRSEVIGLAFAPSPLETWYVPVSHRFLGGGPNVPLGAVREVLGPLLADPERAKAAHGWKETALTLRRSGIELRGVTLDTELASYLADATKYAHLLENVTLDRLGRKLPDAPDDVTKGKVTWAEAPPATAAEYGAARAEAVLELAAIFDPILDDLGLRSLSTDVEIPLGGVLADMEEAGVRVDPAVLRGLSDEFGKAMATIERECHEIAGTAFNLGSPKQLADVLFGKLQLPVQKRTKTGPSTDASVLEALAEQAPIVQKILDWREVQKLKGTYTDVLPTLIHPQTGRIHTCFKQTVAATGRLASIDPNLQNIPIRSELGRRIRDAFIAEDGGVLLSADYSQVELRILAHLSGDPGLRAAFQEGQDIHQRTASEIFATPLAEVTRSQRSAAKAINFGLMYGMGAFRLARDLGISRGEAAEYIERYFARYGLIKRFIEDTLALGRERGYVQTLLGRRRYVPELLSGDAMRRAGAERASINTPVQGSAADIIKLAMLRIQKRLSSDGFHGRMVLQVHDELVFDVPAGEAEAMGALVRREMEGVVELTVPLTVDVHWGKNWNEAH